MSKEQSEFEKIALSVSSLVEEKDKAYGNAFDKAGAFLKLLYPNGIPTDSTDDALTIVRIFDKLMRIATNKDAFGEDPYRDILGYCLLAIRRREKNENARTNNASSQG